jgi:hypothetical protein
MSQGMNNLQVYPQTDFRLVATFTDIFEGHGAQQMNLLLGCQNIS